MRKKLIVLSDGTGNSAAKLFKTNVWKLYEALDLTPSSNQIALYDDGVGTSRFKPWALLTGAFGFGLKRNVLRMYVFLSRHYGNEVNAQRRSNPDGQVAPPDIYGFGFSRGAFTIRVLAGLVARQGLLRLDSESEMCRKAVLSYRRYRKDRFHTKLRIERPFREVRDAAVRLMDWLRQRRPYDPSENVQNVTIRFLGVWDTVAAYGMPIEELRVAIDKFIFPLTFATNDLLKPVQCARHALSIDDERSSFAPVLWDHEEGDRLKQVWFAGVHANVGGGCPDDSLSSVPLAWMAFEARDAGLQFHQQALDGIRGRVSPIGKMYDSRSGLGSLYRYQPRQVRCQAAAGTVSAVPVVHESVVFRMATGFQGYAPIALPQQVQVVDKKGKIYLFEGFRLAASKGEDRFAIASAKPGDEEDSKLADMVASLKAPEADEVKLVSAAVLRRRFAYFATLFLILALLVFPVVPSNLLPFSLLATEAYWIKAPWADFSKSQASVLGDVRNALSLVTPSFMDPWIDAYLLNPWATALLVIGVICFNRRNKALGVEIADRARAAWSIGTNSPLPAPRAGLLDRVALALMASPSANAAWGFTTHKAFPVAVAAMAVALVVVFADRTAFWLKSSSGKVCVSPKPYEELKGVTGQWQKIPFMADDPCMGTGYRVRQGHRYELRLELPPEGPWSDGGHAADWTGLDFSKLSWGDAVLMYVGMPARRHLKEPWFVPIARVGNYGSEEYVLTPADVAEGNKPRDTMTSVIVPRKNAELFLFVNDAYSGLFPLAWLERRARQKSGWSAPHLYGNNSGTAAALIRREDGEND